MHSWADLDHEEQAAAARLSFGAMSKYLHPERTIPKHVEFMSREITATIERGIQTGKGEIIIVSMPPGHIKSDSCSVHLPIWFLDRWADKHVALTSYGSAKANEWGRIIRNTFEEREDLLTEMSPDSKAANRWNTKQGGGMLCTGIGGPLTGFRAHLLIIDDPVKDDEEARSETIQKKHWEWFKSVAYTRCWPSATILVVMTRWNHNDLAGKLLDLDRIAEEEGLPKKKVTEIRFPCLAEEDDPLGREPGAPLWPEGGYDAEWAEATQTMVGGYHWAGMYQQRPAPEGGEVFHSKYFGRYRQDGEHYELTDYEGKVTRHRAYDCWVGQVVDTALTDKEISDWTVVLTFTVTPNMDVLWIDVKRKRLQVPDQWPFLLDVRRGWEDNAKHRWRFQAVESKGSGIGLLQIADREGVPLRELEAVVDKVTRASDAATYYRRGKVFHPVASSWLEDFERELLDFPNGQHDDQVDTVSYAVRSVVGKMKPPRPKPTQDPKYVGLTGYGTGAKRLEGW